MAFQIIPVCLQSEMDALRILHHVWPYSELTRVMSLIQGWGIRGLLYFYNLLTSWEYQLYLCTSCHFTRQLPPSCTLLPPALVESMRHGTFGATAFMTQVLLGWGWRIGDGFGFFAHPYPPLPPNPIENTMCSTPLPLDAFNPFLSSACFHPLTWLSPRL